MSHYKPMGAELIGYVRDYRFRYGTTLVAAKAAVEAGWRPGQAPAPVDPRDAEIATLRADLLSAREALREIAKGITKRREESGDNRADWELARAALSPSPKGTPGSGEGR